MEKVRHTIKAAYGGEARPLALAGVRLTDDEARALHAYVMGDAFDVKFIDSAIVKIERRLGLDR